MCQRWRLGMGMGPISSVNASVNGTMNVNMTLPSVNADARCEQGLLVFYYLRGVTEFYCEFSLNQQT